MSDKIENWQDKTSAQASIKVEVGFLISDDFYYGNQNDPLDIHSGKWRASLYQPKGETLGKFILSANGRLYIREHDPDDGEEYASIHVSLESVKQQSKDIKLRISRIHNELVSAFGNDYWSQ